MRLVMRLRFLVVLFVVTLLVQNTWATVTELLPDSTHYEGRTFFNEYASSGGVLTGRIDFAVYDTTAGNEFVTAGYTNPGSGRYIYAYQIFCDDTATAVLDYFSINGIGENAIADQGDIDAQDDGSGGILPDNYDYNPYPGPVEAFWEFDGGLLVAGEHSYFLVISSDHDWVAGDYLLEPGGDVDPPIPNPEPATIALLSIGAVVLGRKKKHAWVLR